jgi:hypothetical protein
VVEASESGKCDDFTRPRRFGSAHDRRIALEGHVRSIFVVISDVLADQLEQMTLPKNNHWSSNSRRSVPTHRSAYPFCQGERGAILTCSIPR